MICESASGEQLRRLWQNLKTRQRDALTRERQHRMATGGGGPCPDAEIDPNIANITPALFVEVHDSIDSDCNVSDLVTPIEVDPDVIIHQEAIIPPQPQNFINLDHPPTISTIIDASQHTSSDAIAPTTAPVEIELVSQPSSSTHQNNPTQDSILDLSSNEKKLRVQILKNEYLNREKRANELHLLDVKYKKIKNQLEIEILKKKLQEASAKAESAQKNQC